ncbi:MULTISPECIES: hypothetical protein [Streptacidiphilus]|uniref:DUF839 domain-containing protein n=1 Tax=Streptacidiphilus cavernicola TaxID=3342716 RepID=A0ABV6V1E6_9ACTN|nr:hypothetical protein [Streptacidiphilus jeojiense]
MPSRLTLAVAVGGVLSGLLLTPGTAATAATAASARHGDPAGRHGVMLPGHLVLSRTVYTAGKGSIVPGITQLPAGCTTACVTAVADGGYPEVFNNESVDASFGVSSPILLDALTQSGRTVRTLGVPTDVNGDHLVTSFPSKSELGLNLSSNGSALTFMGYVAPLNAPDVSNSNTPGVVDPTNPVGTSYYRAVAELRSNGSLGFTETNAYSGNNGRSAILDNAADEFLMAGNAGNGGNPQPVGVIAGAGAQLATPSRLPESRQQVGQPTPAGGFSVTELGDKADKVGKDTNFRGLTLHDNVVYLTKGSGGNGVNTVYFIDTTGKACPNGVGLPVPGAPLPTKALSYDPATLQSTGLPENMCVLKGFPTALKSTTSFPFGVWFANDTTMYVADEGDGTNTYDPATGSYTVAAAQTGAGLQKWVLRDGTWQLQYTIQQGLALGTPYAVSHYPTGDNPATGLPWAPATDGLRNITGKVDAHGDVTIWGITSTVSGATDEGADPNRLVSVTDRLHATTATGDTFRTLRTAQSGEALRGIVYVPGN